VREIRQMPIAELFGLYSGSINVIYLARINVNNPRSGLIVSIRLIHRETSLETGNLMSSAIETGM